MAAIYQWYGKSTHKGYLDYEYVLLSTDQDWLTRYIGLDYRTGTYTNFGVFYVAGGVSVVSDGKNVFTMGHTPSDVLEQYIWRGNIFSLVADGMPGGTNTVINQMMGITGLDEHLLFADALYPEGGGRTQRYYRDPPYAFGPGYDISIGDGSLIRWTAFLDFNVENNGEPTYGDTAVAVPFNANHYIASFKPYANGDLQFIDSMISPVGEADDSWGWNNQTGIFACIARQHTPFSPLIHLFQMDIVTRAISFIGVGYANNNVYAVGFSSNDYVITLEVEDVPSLPDYYIRAYSRSDETLTLTDSYLLPSKATGASCMQTSRITGRVWVFTNIDAGVYVLHVDDNGLIVIDFILSDFSLGSSGSVGNPIGFLKEPLLITSNGFDGIKEKLYECWEMNEIGSVNRIGAMGNINFYPDDGPVLERPGIIGNAAVFNDSALIAASMSHELQTVGSFSVCMEIKLDNKLTTQHIFSRIRDDIYAGITNEKYVDFVFRYNQIFNKFEFYVQQYQTQYAVQANHLGSPVIGQKYHIYIEYNKQADQISIRVDLGLKDLIQLPLGMTINLNIGQSQRIILGRFAALGSNDTRYMYGSISQLYWFWDVLTETEQNWMYNNGNSRAFSEL